MVGSTAVKVAVHREGDLLTIAHGEEPLTDEEFSLIESSFKEAFAANRYRVRMTVLADAPITLNQRKRTIAAGWDRGTSRAVVVTRSVLVRGGVTALSWFGVPVRSAPPNEYRKIATEYLELSARELKVVLDTCRALRKELTVKAPTLDEVLSLR